MKLTSQNRDGASALLRDPRGVSILGSIAGLIEIDSGWESAAAAALGSLADAVVVQDLSSAVTALTTLRSENLGQADVLVYEPVIGEHIEYHYYYAGEDSHKKAIFKSKYIAKIIDYGRCYFNDKSGTRNTNESKKFYDNLLCKECKPNCGSGKGYGWFKTDHMSKSGFICSQKLNPSHDLRLLYTIGYGSRDGMDPILKTLMKKVVYGKRVIPNFKQFGTEPNPVSGIPLKINNVTDAADALSELVIQPYFVEINNDAYSGSKKLGELHIYGDGKTPMKWIP
jgi:hypothetical protein